jgi:hypothetical protein
MSLILSFDTLVSWFVQVSILAFAGAALPILLRVQHPKTQLVYYHAVLLLCFAIPVIQPWQHPILFVSSGTGSATTPAAIPWVSVLVGVAAFGILVRLCWLGVGLWQLRRYRRAAIPLYPLPESIKEARKQTGADALFCLSADVTGPATLGYIDPIILLPASFALLDHDAQRSIACHELLHVRRRDWLVTMLEEIVGAIFWFNPAIRWLLAQAKLTREQLVDAEVVRMTPPAPYIEALLSMAMVTTGRWAVPAAPFFTEGHLASRMRSILSNPRRSGMRLVGSYVLTAALLFGAGWSLTLWFPLMGEAQIVTAPQGPSMFFRVFVPPDGKVALALRPQQTFNVVVRAPEGPPRNVLHFFNEEVPPQILELIPPPPPPPPPPPDGMMIRNPQFGLVGTAGVRMIAPGDKPSEEELDRFLQRFAGRASVRVDRLDDGTIRSITVQARRLEDAANSITFTGPSVVGDHVTAGTATAEPTAATDGVH